MPIRGAALAHGGAEQRVQTQQPPGGNGALESYEGIKDVAGAAQPRICEQVSGKVSEKT